MNETILHQTFYFRLLFKRLLIVLALFTVCRALFYVFNKGVFADSTLSEIIAAFIYGIRFDVSAIIYYNFLFIFLHLIPIPFRDDRLYRLMTKIVFHLSNVFMMLVSVIDIEYFKYSKKRTTYDVFGMSSDWSQLFLQYLRDFWYLVLILIGLIIIIELLYRKTERRSNKVRIKYLFQSALLIIFGAAFIIGARGGFQLKPIKMSDAALDVNPQNISLVLNTPFTILRTYGRKGLTEVRYMSDDEAAMLVPIHKRKHSDGTFKKMNVVIIIVESLSREFVGRLNRYPGYTPFIDSLSYQGLICTNAYANGTRSMEAVPAILASIPNLMDDSYIFSVYQSNAINSIGSILRDRGYSTSFFHGGTNGTMGFDSFIKLAGFEKYYGRAEYNNEYDYDGYWGIPDEEFLQYTAMKLNETPEPFCATIFTLSSHHPYSLPPKHANDFKGGTMPIQRTIMYTDYSLRKFFKTASSLNWYDNTLFVITGDHTPAETEHPFYRSQVGMYALPIIFFHPGSDLLGTFESVVQQIDIMPSILDYLHYDREYIAFGNSIFDTSTKRFVYNFLDSYQIFSNEYALSFNGETSTGVIKYGPDSMSVINLINSHPEVNNRLEKQVKGMIQIYNHALIHNEMTMKYSRN